MTVIRLLLFNRFGVALGIAAAISGPLLVLVWPTQTLGAVQEAASDTLTGMGVGVLLLAVWTVWVVSLLLTSVFRFIRRWRLVLGSGLLVAASLAILSYVDAHLPLVGDTTLGGDLGSQIRGDDGILGILRTTTLAIVGGYLIVPALFYFFIQITRRTARFMASASARIYRAVRVRQALGQATSAVARAGKSTVRRSAANIARTRRESLGKDLDEFLRSSPRTTPAVRPLASAIDSAQSSAESYLPGGESCDGTVAMATRSVDLSEDDIQPAAGVPNPTPPERSERRRIAVQPTANLPQLSLLEPGVAAAGVTSEHQATALLIEEALSQHGVEVHVAEIRPGPSVTMFGLVPGWNRKHQPGRARTRGGSNEEEPISEARNRVKVDSILAREKDLALALAAPSLRIEAPVPGESVVGVEVPNKIASMVTLRSVMESVEYAHNLKAGGLPVAIGLASAGEPVAIDLLNMPHLLIAGATGSGKSVCINSIISSLITHQPPSKVQMLLVDPKRVELTPYNGIPHLVTPVVVEPDRVVRLLRGAIQEMLRRYKLLEAASVRNIQSYNKSPRTTEEMPYFVICIDELADLMMTASFEVEQSICRLAQLGRATGIHLVVATQRPSVDVVTGLIKANFPSRIAFAVASQVDSRTILDATGADRLLGRGDMLFLSSDAPKPRRVQGALVTEEETEALCDHWRTQPAELGLPLIALDELAREAEVIAAESAAGQDFDENDSLYDRALQLASANRQLSTSLLQRRLRIGYPRAARLMDQLEDQGIVGSTGEPGKPREVLYLPAE